MRSKLFLIVAVLFLFQKNTIEASHISSAFIELRHVAIYDYEISLHFYTNGTDVPWFQPNVTLKVFQRNNLAFVDSFICSIKVDSIVPPALNNCGTLPFAFYEKIIYADTFTLSPNVYNHPGGYLIKYETCCRSSANNIQNAQATTAVIMTHFPPVVDNSGNPFVNNSPKFKMPVTEFAVHHNPFISDYGGLDVDGDSLVYELYSPADAGTPVGGSITAVSSPWPDPKTQVVPVNWMSGYGEDNQIQGYPGPNPSPNRLQIDPQTGVLTMTPNFPSPAKYNVGLLCREYRNGVLIGNYFREITLFVANNNLPPNNPPICDLAPIPALAVWNADTLVFLGSPVCLNFNVTDPDAQSDIEMKVISSSYEENDLSFLQANATITNQDTFQATLCFHPDSFLSQATFAEVQAISQGCYLAFGDTIPFWFKFSGYSNAGTGGEFTLPMTSLSGSIDLFYFLTDNPHSGGTWYDLDGNNHMNPNGFLEWKYITTPKTYRFIYVQQEPNYPPDTAELTLNFVLPNSIENLNSEEISVYPNPASKELFISIPELNGNIEFTIHDLRGLQVKNEILNSVNSIISISDIPEGLYFYQLETGQRGKILIQR